MDGMATAKHAPKTRSTADVWFVLIITGGASAILQMWHATHSGGTVLLIAGLVGLVPPAAAIGLSHVVAGHKSAALLRVITVAVMLSVMAASASASAAVIRPIDGPQFSWVLALALDAAALASVWVLLGDQERKAAEGSAVETAERAAAEARRTAAEATGRAFALEADLVSVRADLATAVATAEALRSAAPPLPSRRSSRPAAKARRSAHGSADTQDLTAELRAIQMLDAHPEMRAKGQGAELGRRLGVSPAHGRRLHARLTSEERPADALQERSAPASDERAEERS
jgi:hypothetical protein